MADRVEAALKGVEDLNEQCSDPPPVFLEETEWYKSKPVLGYSAIGKIRVVTYEQPNEDEPFAWYTNCSERWNLGAQISHWMPIPSFP